MLRIRGLLEEHYQAATANRMLAALRGVLKECWQAQLMSIEDYQAAISIPAVRGESESYGLPEAHSSHCCRVATDR